MKLFFDKYQGTGNDFIMLDNRSGGLENLLTVRQIKHLCDRRFGIGADGLILLSPSGNTDFRMIYYNSDGNESTMCGNGGRCLIAYAYRLGIKKDTFTFDAIDGIHHATIENGRVSLEMIRPTGYKALNEYQVWLDTGSPHFVWFDQRPVEEIDVFSEGREIRYSPPYRNQGGTNVNFVNQIDHNNIQVRTYERGVEDETLSCGTGVTACAYAHFLQNGNDSGIIHIQTPGGMLDVEIQNQGKPDEKVFLIGPATYVFSGEITLEEV